MTMLYLLFVFPLFFSSSVALDTSFYDKSCPDAVAIVKGVMKDVVAAEPRMGASILRMHFHDCFVQGCDASILLDDTPSFRGEKKAPPNFNSVRGYEVIDRIKSKLELQCPLTVSCADILALAARDGVVLLGGPYWDVPLGRKDATSTHIGLATLNLPKPRFDYPDLVQSFAKQGLTERDLLALSGAHTIGYARCVLFRNDLKQDLDVNPKFAEAVSGFCGQNASRLFGLDYHTDSTFDNLYYSNLIAKEGLLHSDRQLLKGKLPEILDVYASNATAFFEDFVKAMVKMSSLSPPAGQGANIRRNCRTS